MPTGYHHYYIGSLTGCREHEDRTDYFIGGFVDDRANDAAFESFRAAKVRYTADDYLKTFDREEEAELLEEVADVHVYTDGARCVRDQSRRGLGIRQHECRIRALCFLWMAYRYSCAPR